MPKSNLTITLSRTAQKAAAEEKSGSPSSAPLPGPTGITVGIRIGRFGSKKEEHMSNLYQEAPNQVKIALTDDTGEAERFVVGQTLDEAIAIIEAAFGSPTKEAAKSKKPRKKRRTKAEMTATAEAADPVPFDTETAPLHSSKNNKKEKAWA